MSDPDPDLATVLLFIWPWMFLITLADLLLLAPKGFVILGILLEPLIGRRGEDPRRPRQLPGCRGRGEDATGFQGRDA